MFSAVSGLEFSLSKDHRECEFSQENFTLSSFLICYVCKRFAHWIELAISMGTSVIDFSCIGIEYCNLATGDPIGHSHKVPPGP